MLCECIWSVRLGSGTSAQLGYVRARLCECIWIVQRLCSLHPQIHKLQSGLQVDEWSQIVAETQL